LYLHHQHHCLHQLYYTRIYTIYTFPTTSFSLSTTTIYTLITINITIIPPSSIPSLLPSPPFLPSPPPPTIYATIYITSLSQCHFHLYYHRLHHIPSKQSLKFMFISFSLVLLGSSKMFLKILQKIFIWESLILQLSWTLYILMKTVHICHYFLEVPASTTAVHLDTLYKLEILRS
jgi:hypothetical protein